VRMDVDGVFVRSGPSINYGVVGTQSTASRGTVDQSCVNDSASPRVFCHVGFDAGVSGWLTVEHLIVLSTPTSASPLTTLLQKLPIILYYELAEELCVKALIS